MGFRNFAENEEIVEKLLLEFSTPAGSPPIKGQMGNVSGKPWSATKDEIMNMWQNMRPDVPIFITPMVEKGDGGTQSYGEDGIRITGSFEFISSILGRLKEIIGYENPQTKLRLVLRGIDKKRDARADRNSYVFYLNLEKRSHGKPGRPKKGGLQGAPQAPEPPKPPVPKLKGI